MPAFVIGFEEPISCLAGKKPARNTLALWGYPR